MRSVVAAGIGVVAGIWMMAAPALLGYSGAAATSDRIVGPTAAAVAWIAATEATRSTRWLNVPLGLWAVASAFLLDGSTAAAVSSIATGVVLLASAIAIGRMPTERYAGGWKALMEDDGRGHTE